MTPSNWPLRLVPRRSAPLWLALLISLGSIAGAIVARGLFVGFDNASGISVTYFPAFMIATLYAGPRWGWATLAASLLIGIFTPTAFPAGLSRPALIGLFAVSGAITVTVATALHAALVRLEESQAAERKVLADLEATEARFRTLADSAPILMWVSKLDSTREFANRAFVEFVGGDYEQALGFDWRAFIHPDDVPRITEAERAMDASGEDYVWEARYRRADGAWRWLRSISQRRYGPDGELIGYIGVGYDITEARQAQADLKRINDLLAERVEATLAERDQAEAALHRAQKLEAVGQLTGGVAHDFNNLLTVIIGALDLMQRHPGDADRRERMIEAAQAAARRGERLTQQLLAFSRRQALKPERVAIDDMLRESEPLLRRAVGEAVTLTVAPGAADAVANIDASQFDAAVMNLVVNARDATPPGGRIRVESYRCTLGAGEAEGADPGDYICISVHDTGEGMDPDVAARVFEPFFTTKGPGRGTGLGLSQVYGFARQSGGAAVVESARGKGATIRVYLPLAREEADHAQAQAAPVAAPAGPGLRVLLVEDEASVGDMVEAMLRDLGHQVVRAETAAEALAILRKKSAIDLLLTDVIMPGGKNGVELAREAVSLRPDMPVILSSGYTGETLDEASGAPWPLLLKPYSADALAALIDSAVGRAPQPA
ncbi:MAG: ATP-binding protein [Phenylobacterium sp.]